MVWLKVYGQFTANSESNAESEKDQRTIGRDKKNKRQTSKKIFTFAFAFAWCGQAFMVHVSQKSEYKDVYRITIAIPQCTHIFKVTCWLKVHNRIDRQLRDKMKH